MGAPPNEGHPLEVDVQPCLQPASGGKQVEI